MRNAPIAKFNVAQRCVTRIPSFGFGARWTTAGKIVLRHLAVRSGLLVCPKLGWLFTKMALGTRNDSQLCGVFPPGKKRQEESQIDNDRRSQHRAFYPGVPLRDGGVSDLPGISRTQRIAGTSDRQNGEIGRPRQAFGHPMIPVRARVDNDARLGPPRRILMVTGSNMSGKTTLLRSIGTNVLLAKAGGPVCAKKFELPWVEVVTSIRAMDSVSDGISLFMAELSSIKVVVEAAHRATLKGSHPVLYLLDEVLLGTNIDERKGNHLRFDPEFAQVQNDRSYVDP